MGGPGSGRRKGSGGKSAKVKGPGIGGGRRLTAKSSGIQYRTSKTGVHTTTIRSSKK